MSFLHSYFLYDFIRIVHAFFSLLLQLRSFNTRSSVLEQIIFQTGLWHKYHSCLLCSRTLPWRLFLLHLRSLNTPGQLIYDPYNRNKAGKASAGLCLLLLLVSHFLYTWSNIHWRSPIIASSMPSDIKDPRLV